MKKEPNQEQEQQNVRVRGTEERMLPVRLTQTELLAAGRELVSQGRKIRALEDELTNEKTRVKAAIGKHEYQRARLAAMIDTGEQERSIVCDQVLDFGINTYSIVRKDTGEVVHEQEPIPERMQQLELGDRDGAEPEQQKQKPKKDKGAPAGSEAVDGDAIQPTEPPADTKCYLCSKNPGTLAVQATAAAGSDAEFTTHWVCQGCADELGLEPGADGTYSMANEVADQKLGK